MRIASSLPALLDATLTWPCQLRASDPPPEAVLADLPFEGSERSRVIVDLAPEGSQPFRLFLDTGASRSVVTPGMARELGVHVRRLKSSPYRRATRLGRDLQFRVDDRRGDTGSRTGWEYGLLGGDFLAEYVLEIDFPGRRVRFLDPERFEIPEAIDAEGEAVLPVKLVSSRPAVEIFVEGHPLLVTLDTGAPHPAILSAKVLKKAGLPWSPLGSFEAGTVVGPMKLELAELGELRLGAFALGPGFPVFVAPRGWYNLGIESESVIGYGLLSSFLVRIDYPHKRLWLRRDPEARITLFGRDYTEGRRVGVLLARSLASYHAAVVFPGSPAEQRGLRAGDRIERVGRNPGGLTERRIVRALAEGVSIGVRRQIGGESKAVSLEGSDEPSRPPPADWD